MKTNTKQFDRRSKPALVKEEKIENMVKTAKEINATANANKAAKGVKKLINDETRG